MLGVGIWISDRYAGNILNLAEPQRILEHGSTVGGNALREHLEATNYAEAFTAVLASADQAEPLTLELILRLHGPVMEYRASNASPNGLTNILRMAARYHW